MKYRLIIIIMVNLWCYIQSGVTELLIMRDPHYGRICFKSVKSAFSTAKNAELFGLYPIHEGSLNWCLDLCVAH